MSLQPGTRLGPYEILSPLGAGGMGEVWKAKDTRLDRLVAVKVLPEHLAKHPDSLARFEREAKAVAALNHPNITGIFDIGNADGVAYAAMELLEGESLRTRLDQGPLTPRKATELAIQMAQGLAAAHEKGVVHRDLKPDNLWITKEGRLKILDFGLAKQLPAMGLGSDSFVPTAAIQAGHNTEKGMILGTLGYMSPEQVRGETVDARADLFSFGVVLFEMLTGKRAFARDTASDTMAAILRDDPPEFVGTSRPIPMALRRIIDHCLEKAPDRRFRDAHDVAFALENLSSPDSSASITAPFAVQNRRTTGFWATLALMLILGATLGGWLLRGNATIPVRRWELVTGPMNTPQVDTTLLSPDGNRMVYLLGRKLWLRELSEANSRELSTIEQVDLPLCWSPDGTVLVYSAKGKIWRTALGTEPPMAICDAPNKGAVQGGAWLKNGDLVLSVWRSGLYRVPASGGTPQVEVTLDHTKEVDYHQLHALPDGESIIAVLHSISGIHTLELIRNRNRTVVLHDDRAYLVWSSFIEPGFLLFVRVENAWTQPALWALPFSPSRGKATGPAFLVEPGVGDASASRGGLVTILASRPKMREMVWLTSEGKASESLGPPLEQADQPALSPDGRRVAVAANTVRGRDIWELDLLSRSLSPVTDARSGCASPTWAPDGRSLTFDIQTPERWFPEVATIPAGGTGALKKFAPGVNPRFAPDGKSLVFMHDRDGDTDLMRVSLEGGAPEPVWGAQHSESLLGFSPDGRWLLYSTEESGQRVAYIRRYPEGTDKQPLPMGTVLKGLYAWNPANRIHWVANGRIYCWDGKAMWALDIETRGAMKVGQPRILFQDPGEGMSLDLGFDVDSRSGRILALRDIAGPTMDTHVIRVIEHVDVLLVKRGGTR